MARMVSAFPALASSGKWDPSSTPPKLLSGHRYNPPSQLFNNVSASSPLVVGANTPVMGVIEEEDSPVNVEKTLEIDPRLVSVTTTSANGAIKVVKFAEK